MIIFAVIYTFFVDLFKFKPGETLLQNGDIRCRAAGLLKFSGGEEVNEKAVTEMCYLKVP